jgi:hypothetical protein
MKTFKQFLLEAKETLELFSENSLKKLIEKYFKNVVYDHIKNEEYCLYGVSQYIKIPTEYRNMMDMSAKSIGSMCTFIVNKNGNFDGTITIGTETTAIQIPYLHKNYKENIETLEE